MAFVLAAAGELLAAGIGLLYGLGWLGVAIGYSIGQKEFWRGNKAYESHLFKASHELWSLSETDETLAHTFLRLSSGVQLHYLTPRQSPASTNTLVVFVHGFPDTAYLFARQLRSAFAAQARLVALDVPGCGGSDSLPSYGPDQVLNAVAEAIEQLKREYLASGSSGRCILVGHDWGGVIGFRLAAESKGLIDQLVTLNSLYPAYAEEMLKGHVSRGSDHLSNWRFREACKELGPVLAQANKSGYTYMLTLPFPVTSLMPRVASCLIKYAHGIQYKRCEKGAEDVYAMRLAMAYGPSSAECTRLTSSPSYGPSILTRSKTSPPGDWDGRVRLYSDGLLRDKWTPSFSQTTGPDKLNSGADAADAESDGPQAFQCSVHIIFGLQDIALDPRIVVDGIEKYFQDGSSSRVERLPECGHWSIIEEEGAIALDRALTDLLATESRRS